MKEIHQTILAKEYKKRYRDRVKQYKQNKTFQKNERKFYQYGNGTGKSTTGCKGNKTIWVNVETEKNKRKAEWINNMKIDE